MEDMAASQSQNSAQVVTGITPPNDGLVFSCHMRVERKFFTFDLRENIRGQFVRITEEVNGRRDAIVIPLPGLAEFRDKLNEVVEASKSIIREP
jgi:hypothetical protein